MDLDARIRRRAQRGGSSRHLLIDHEALSPVAHIEDPPGRGPVLEQILDYVDPVFEGDSPGDAVLCGPAGSGKSAVVTSLFERLDAHTLGSQSVIHTSTRAQAPDPRAFVYLDARRIRSHFQLYHHALDDLVSEPVPEHGVSTADLRARLAEEVAGTANTVFAIDHLDEPRTMSMGEAQECVAELGEAASLLAVGRTLPEGTWADTTIEVRAYSEQVLVDVLMTRASGGLAREALEHAQARRITAWADGNAHDALAALYGAAATADAAGRPRLTREDIDIGITAVPRPSKALGRLLTLPENRQLVLRELLELPEERLDSVADAAAALAERPVVDLSEGTVRRFLYELAENGLVERIQREDPDGYGRPPSRIEPRFPTLVFRQLYDLRH